jgi:hypothetical protein
VASFSVLLAGSGIFFQVSAVQNQGEIQWRQSERHFATQSLDTVPPGNFRVPVVQYLSLANSLKWTNTVKRWTKSIPRAGQMSVCAQRCLAVLCFERACVYLSVCVCVCCCCCCCFFVLWTCVSGDTNIISDPKG